MNVYLLDWPLKKRTQNLVRVLVTFVHGGSVYSGSSAY